jgi:hypothetical protein
MEKLSFIPLGQPIIVGHYSERRDRNYRNRIFNSFDKSFRLSSEADHLESRAEASASNTAIYADDDNPVALIEEKLARLEKERDEYKEINRLIRRKDRAGLESKYGIERAAKLLTPSMGGSVGIPSYKLTNLGAEIRRLEKRRNELSILKCSERSEWAENDIKIVEDPAIARIQLVFKSKPDEKIRTILKSNGFRWAPSEGAWQRQLNGNGKAALHAVLKLLNPESRQEVS